MYKIKISKNLRKITFIAMLTLALIFVMAISPKNIYAEETDQENNIPQDAESYTLTYPDGTVITENENGEPLTYEDVIELLKEENWKEMASGLTSDENGEVILDPQWVDGTIKIVETKVPEGYQFGEETEKIVELVDGETTFINPKENDSPDPIDDPNKDDENPDPNQTTDPNKTTVETAVVSDVSLWLIAFFVSSNIIIGTKAFKKS